MRTVSVPAVGALLLAGALAGCGGGSSMLQPPKSPVPSASATLQGEAYGGQQPVVGLELQLYETGSSGYGSAATGLLPTPLPTTDSNGRFSFATPTCTQSTDEVYMVGLGGNPVAFNNGGTTNANLTMMVVLGKCTDLNTITHLHINEMTTVAAVWALAPFMAGNTTSYLHVGTSAGNAIGLQLAFADAAQVASTSTGVLPGTLPANGTLPTDELNTVADILAACINSAGGAANDNSSCGDLFLDAPSANGGYPTDVVTAAMNMAQNPARNVTALFHIASATGPFQTELGSAPSAWTVAIAYSGGGLSAPTGIAADASGNIWVANSGSTRVSQFSNAGAPNASFGTGGLDVGATPGGLAIDLSGNAWVSTSGDNVKEVNPGGSVLTTLTGNSLNGPTSIAIDGGGNLWVVNAGSGANSVSGFSSAGTPLTNSAFSGGGIAAPVAIAINGSANVNCSDCH